jgi:cytochrome c peroxidase
LPRPFRLSTHGVALAAALALAGCDRAPSWTAAERMQIEALWIGSLPQVPADPSNGVADDAAAATFGRALFFDPRLSANEGIACVTCHRPDRAFTDGLPVAQGLATASRNTPGLAGVAHRPWLYWDGRADSLWSQVAGPLEDPREMGRTRTGLAQMIGAHHRAEYERVFGPAPGAEGLPAASPAGTAEARAAWQGLTDLQRRNFTRVLSNVGKALAAYERTLQPRASRFDAFAHELAQGEPEANARLARAELRGLRVFLGKGQCLRCHEGPLFTDNAFHNIGLAPAPGRPPDLGRAHGVKAVLASELNCLGPFSDARAEDCDHLQSLTPGGADRVGAFKTPGLRDVAETAPYMHDGRFATLAEVLNHHNRAPAPPEGYGRSALTSLELTAQELVELEAFLRSLTEVR